MVLGLVGEERVEATGGDVSLQESYAVSAQLFASLEDAVGEAAASSPEALFNHLTSEQDTMWFWQNGNATEGSATELSFFKDNQEFQADLYAASQTEGFWDSKASITEGIQRAVIESDAVSNDQFYDFIAEQSPDLAGLAATIKADPDLADSFRNALEKDPTMLPGLTAMAEGNGSINIEKLQTALQDPNNRRIFGDVLDKIAESPDDEWNFATLNTLAGHIENNRMTEAAALLGEMDVETGAIDFQAFIEFIVTVIQGGDVSTAVADLVQDLGLEGRDAELFTGAAEFVGGMTQGTVGEYYAVYDRHREGIHEFGGDVAHLAETLTNGTAHERMVADSALGRDLGGIPAPATGDETPVDPSVDGSVLAANGTFSGPASGVVMAPEEVQVEVAQRQTLANSGPAASMAG